MDPAPAQPVAVEPRPGVQNPRAPRHRGRLQSAWEALAADKDRFNTLIAKADQDNQNLLSRVSPSASRKLRTTADHWKSLVDLQEPELDQELLWDMDIVEKHSMKMLPVLVRTHTCTYIYMLIFSKFELSKGSGRGEGGSIVTDTLLEKAMQFANVICTYGQLDNKTQGWGKVCL